MEQMWGAIAAVFGSWNNQARHRLPPAIWFRRMTGERREHLLDGVRNMGDDCGTGVAFTRTPPPEIRFSGANI